MKTLILYLSATGNTKRLAETIADKLRDADLLPIKLKTSIPKNEFWLNFKFGFLMTMNWGFRYDIEDVNLDCYDQVVIGCPVWINRAAPPVIQVIKKWNIEHKIKGVFVTCGGVPGEVIADVSNKLNIEVPNITLIVSKHEEYGDPSVQTRIDKFVNLLKHVEVSTPRTPINEV